MTTKDLGQAQLVPVARPVSAYVRPLLRGQTAGAAQPMEVSGASNFNLVRQEAPGNVSGYYQNNNLSTQVLAQGQGRVNKLQQVAEALEPFGANLMRTLQMGAEVYASREYQEGMNEVMRAYANADGQLNQGELVYAEQNREMARVSPMAALSMDLVNPYRMAGRRRQLNQLAGSEIEQALKAQYRANAGELARLEEDDPRINELKAGVIAGITERFGIDQGDPGFAEFVLPKLNSAWDWVTDQHFRDRQGLLKNTQAGLTANFLLTEIPKLLADGMPEAEITAQVNGVIADGARRFGIPGEGVEMRQETLRSVYAMALQAGRDDIANVVAPLIEASGMTPWDQLSLEHTMSERRFTQLQRVQEQQEAAFRDEVALLSDGASDPNAVLQGAQELLATDERFAGLSPARAQDVLKEQLKTTDDLRNLLGAGGVDDMESFMMQAEGLYGTDWQPEELTKVFEQLLQAVPPSQKAEHRRRWADLRRQKNEEGTRMDSLVESTITSTIKARLAQAFPTIGEAGLQGYNNESLEQLIGKGRQNMALSYQKQQAEYRKRVMVAIAQQEAAVGRPLSSYEKQALATETLQKLTPQNFPDLYPGSPLVNQKPAQGAPAGGGGGGAQSSTPAAKAPLYGLSQLDQIPNRAQALQKWNSQPILRPESTIAALQQATKGKGTAAFAPSLVRAAQAAGTDPGTLLVRQLEMLRTPDGKPAISIPQAARAEIIRKGKAVAGGEAYRQGQRQGGGGNLLQQFGGWLMNTLIPPARSAELTPLALRPTPPKAQPVQLAVAPARPTTGTPKPPAPRPMPGLTIASHPDTGRGFTMPGMRDSLGRPVVLAQGTMASFAQMVRDSGGVVRPQDIASAQRSPQKNRAVNGAEGSNHLAGNAIDIHGASKAWIKANGARYGWRWLDYDGHDGHFDYVGGGGDQPNPRGGPAPRLGLRRTDGGEEYVSPLMRRWRERLGGGGDVAMAGGRIPIPARRRNPSSALQMASATSSQGPFSGLLKFIYSGEGGYESFNRGGAGDSPGPYPGGLTSRTIGEVMRLQQTTSLRAVGAPQFIPSTLPLAMRAAGLTPSDRFSPENQDRMAIALIVEGSKRPRLARFIRGESDDLMGAWDDFAHEWASVPLPNGRTAYPGAGGNAAHHRPEAVRQALLQAREAYLRGRK